MAGIEIPDEELLLEVNAAIRAIFRGGQSYKIGAREFTKGDLATLYKMRKELQISINDTTYGTRAFAEWAKR